MKMQSSAEILIKKLKSVQAVWDRNGTKNRTFKGRTLIKSTGLRRGQVTGMLHRFVQAGILGHDNEYPRNYYIKDLNRPYKSKRKYARVKALTNPSKPEIINGLTEIILAQISTSDLLAELTRRYGDKK